MSHNSAPPASGRRISVGKTDSPAVVDVLSLRVLLTIGVLILAGTSLSSAGGFENARLSLESFGPVRVGMTIAEPQRAAGVETQLDDSRFASENCSFLRVVLDPNVQFMIEDGKVSRIDITDAHHKTVEGVGIGDTEARAQSVYGGKLEVEPHKYLDNGHYLILRSQNKKSALLFETDGKRITSMRAGVVPSVEYVEGCL
jgi:hypothetical protein